MLILNSVANACNQEEYPQLRDGILTKLAENFSQIRNSAFRAFAVPCWLWLGVPVSSHRAVCLALIRLGVPRCPVDHGYDLMLKSWSVFADPYLAFPRRVCY